MMGKISILCLTLLVMVSTFISAQPPDYSQLDPNPYDPKTDPNPDMFISSWKESMPRRSHGTLIERDIFTQCLGDPLKPASKGAVLTFIKRFTHAHLDAHVSTFPTTLKGEQEIFYIDSGKGIMKAGSKSAELYEGIGVLMPSGIEFTMTNTGDEPLTMYIVTEEIPEGFTPKKEMVVKDENIVPFTSTSVHWCHMYKGFIGKDDGLAVLRGMGPCWYSPMTMGQPHSHGEDIEEIWFALKGDITILLGKQIRKLLPGSAYKIPPNGKTPHSNVNNTDETIKMFWFMN